LISLRENVSLQAYNTLALKQQARYFCEVSSEQELVEVCEYAQENKLSLLLLGEGSNVVFTDDFSGLVVRCVNRGVQVIEESDDHVLLSVAAGENWHHFVESCLDKGWYGLENLALIPGTVGAAPVQNIGAYGVELSQFLHSVEVYDREQSAIKNMTTAECHLSYRHSIFKDFPQRYIVVNVQLRLNKQDQPQIQYAALQEYFSDKAEQSLSARDVFNAVVAVRQSKLPDPKQIPNVGSFFKNPVIDNQRCNDLLKRYPGMPVYAVNHQQSKLAAGWLIDQAGWKGYRENNVGVHDKQALVLCNYGQAAGHEVMSLANKIKQDIQKRFEIELEQEPSLIG